jgi:hypothetical protein
MLGVWFNQWKEKRNGVDGSDLHLFSLGYFVCRENVKDRSHTVPTLASYQGNLKQG